MKNHSKIIESLLSGEPLDKIAQEAHIKPSTLHAHFLDPEFRRALDASLAALDAELLTRSLTQLRSLLAHSDPKILLSAIETVLKRDLNLLDKRPQNSDGCQTVIWKWADQPVPTSPEASRDPDSR